MRVAERVLSLAKEQLTFPLSCLGIGLISTWSELSFIHPPVPYSGSPEVVFQLFNMGTVVVAAAIAIALRAGLLRHALVTRDGHLALTLALLLAATAMNFAGAVLGWGGAALPAVSAVVGGAGLALLFIMWFEVVSHLNPVQLLLCYALGAMGRVALIWLCGGMSPDRLFSCLAAVSVCAVGLLVVARNAVAARDVPVLARHSGTEEQAATPVEGACSFPLKPLLVVLTGTLALSMALRMMGNGWGINGNPGVLVAGALVVGAVLARGEAFEFRWLWQGSLGFIAAFLVIFAWGRGALPFLAAFFVCVSYELCLMLMYSILGNLVYRNFYNSTFLFSVEIAIALTSGTVGGLLCDGIERWFPGHATVVLALACGLFALLFAAAAVHAFSKRNLDGKWSNIIRKPIAHDTDLLLERTRLGLRCHELAEEAGLSAREEEVLLLIAQRKKPAAIAAQLVIEVSTVNTHKKHIYRKLDVHSAKELQARLGSATE